MLHIGIAKIHPGKESRLLAWFQEIEGRRNEVLQTFNKEGTRHEQVYIVPTEGCSLLVYATEVEDRDKAITAYRESSFAIDAEHRAVLQECLSEKLRLKPVFDLQATFSPDDAASNQSPASGA